MTQLRHRLGFTIKTLNRFLVGQASGENHLDGDLPVETLLPGPVDHTHPTATDLFEQFVIAERVTKILSSDQARFRGGLLRRWAASEGGFGHQFLIDLGKCFQ